MLESAIGFIEKEAGVVTAVIGRAIVREGDAINVGLHEPLREPDPHTLSHATGERLVNLGENLIKISGR